MKSQEGERVREERVSQIKSVGRKKIHVPECKGSLKGLGFSHVCVSGRSESRRAKAAGAEPSGEMSGQKESLTRALTTITQWEGSNDVYIYTHMCGATITYQNS